MTEVWVVTYGYERDEVVGVFTSREAADAAMCAYNTRVRAVGGYPDFLRVDGPVILDSTTRIDEKATETEEVYGPPPQPIVEMVWHDGALIPLDEWRARFHPRNSAP